MGIKHLSTFVQMASQNLASGLQMTNYTDRQSLLHGPEPSLASLGGPDRPRFFDVELPAPLVGG